ncbi:MAG: AAA family ATPase, partial [Acidimicrobiia bacterium]
LVFVDISGFTALSEKLAARGRIGAEELTSVLDRVFGDMLLAAYERRGSLLKFGGDALLLLFEGEGHEVQATSAAMEMRASLRRAADEKTSVGRIALKMTVGVWSGVVDAYLVGGSHRELLLAGDGIDGVVAVEGSAEPNEIIIADSTAAHLPGRMLGESNGVGTRLRGRTVPAVAPGPIVRDATKDEDLESFVPTALRARLSSGVRDPEHKVATVAFVKFSGVPELLAAEGHEAVAAALDTLLAAAQSALDAEGATFLASDADTGGGKLIAVAGVPDVREDAEGRLLRAMRTIVDTEVPLKVRAGLQRGHVFVAEPGTPFRATFTVMGDTVNTAARLMAAAKPGEIYASPEVLERSATLFRTVALPPIAAKGKAEGLTAAAVFEEIGRREIDASHDLPFVGRDEEMARITDILDGGGRLTLVGDTGIGKTRLLTEALDRHDGSHLVIKAEPAGKENAYWAFRDPLRASLDIPRTTQEEMAQLLSARVAGIAPSLIDHLPLLGDVLQIQVTETPTTQALGDSHRPAETARVMGDFLEAHLGRDHVLVIEDLHWLDEVGIGLVHALAARLGTPKAMLVSARQVEGLDLVGDQLPVGPLSHDAMEIAARTATQAVPPRPEVLEEVIERADGNPLFLTELLAVLGSVGSIDEVPDSLAGVAGVQIDALPPLSRQVLRVASVLGRSFRKVVLDNLLEAEGLSVSAATRHDLSEFLDTEGHRWRFHHAVIHDAAYQGLSYGKRRELHARAGAVVERLAGDHPEAVAEFLARHYAEAGVDDKAWHYGMLAGEHARKTYTNTAAEQYLRLAIAA